MLILIALVIKIVEIVNIIVMERREREINAREINKLCTVQLFTQPVPKKKSAASRQLPLVYILNMMLYCMEYPFGLFRSAVLTVVPQVSSHTPHCQSKGN